MTSTTDVIEYLRGITPPPVTEISIEQMQQITRDVWDCIDLDQTLTRPELSGLTREDIISFVAAFGQHRAQSNRRGRTPILFPHEVGMLLMPSREEIVALRDARRKVDADRARGKHRRDVRSHLPPELDDAPVIVPEGYLGKGRTRRDIRLSLAALVVDFPSEAAFIRYHARAYPKIVTTANADHAQLIHWLLSRGLHQTLMRLTSKEHTLVQYLLGGYQIVEDALRGTHRAREVITEHAPGRNLTDLKDALLASAWIDQAEFSDIARVVDLALAAPDNRRIQAALAGKTRRISAWMSHRNLTDIANLSDAQLLALLRTVGMDLEDDPSEEIRRDLRNIGLEYDLDVDLAEGLRAHELGVYDAFLQSRTARVDGDPQWESIYSHACASLTA